VTAVFALFLLRAAVGLLEALAFVPEKAGGKFFKFCSGAASFMLTGGLLFVLRRLAAGGEIPEIPFPRLFLSGVFGSLLCAVLYNRAWHFSWRGGRGGLLLGSVLAGFTAFWAASPVDGRVLALAADLTSSLLLGAAAAAMILGHYYLVVLDLPTSALKRLTLLLCVGLLLRGVVVAIALLGPVRAGYVEAAAVAQGLFSADGIFVWMRVLFGLAGPASLLWFIWKTVEIRSTQSATGILYVQLFLVLSGELLSTYLGVVAGFQL
jgi:hypothetical protein